MQPDYEYWMRLDEWPLEAAIFLLLDFEPGCPDARDIWRIIESQGKRERRYSEDMVFSKDPLKGIIRKAREYKNFAWASYRAHKLRLSGIGDFGVKATVEPEGWLRWAQSKQLPLLNPLQDFLKEIEQRGKPKPTQPMTSDSLLIETERDSLLKIVLGMAMAAYDYKPSAPRNPATGESRGSISADLQRLGLTLDADTVRKFIKEAETRFKDIIQNSQKS